MAKKILVIEDEEIMIGILEKKLSQASYAVDVARDGVDGLEKMRENKPDLILLDLIMPKLGGFGVIKKMKEDPLLKDIPIIIISNSGQPVELNKVQKLGVKDWLIKINFNPKEIIDKVRKQIGE